jgi:iron complex outermembrane receptor protein
MSELIQKQDNRATIRWKLLTGVSALALTVSSASIASADDSTRPQIWIELGGQLSRLADGQENFFAPDFPNSPARPSVFTPSQKFERPPLFGIDEYGALSFQPEGSDWVLSASIRYGRSAAKRHVRQQTNPSPFVKYYYTSNPADGPGKRLHRNTDFAIASKFADTNAQTSEQHMVLDFQAGKDVGLGMFGSSVVSLGARFAQFRSKSDIALKSNPDWHFKYFYLPSAKNLGFLSSKFAYGQIFHSNQASLQADRSFHGIGPSLSWSASTPFAGTLQDGQLALDWGVNASLLFGRQRAKTHHQATARYHSGGLNAPLYRPITYQGPAVPNHTRSRNVTVPNIGGFAGMSFNYADAKVSFGYRADMFFNAIDGGIDTRKNENRGFFGPFASISVGLGD